MAVVRFCWSCKHLRFDDTQTLQDIPRRWPSARVFGETVQSELHEIRRAARTGQLPDLVCVDAKRRRTPLERVVARQLSRRDLAEDDAKGEDIRREVELVPKQDLGRHVRIGPAERQPFALFLVPRRDAREAKVCDLEAAVCGDEQVLALEIAVDALARVEVGQCPSNVRRKREPKTPREGLRLVEDVCPKVAILDELGHDEDPSVRVRSLGQPEVENDVGVPGLPERDESVRPPGQEQDCSRTS